MTPTTDSYPRALSQFNEQDFTVIVRESCTPLELRDFLAKDAVRVSKAHVASWGLQMSEIDGLLSMIILIQLFFMNIKGRQTCINAFI